MLFHTLSQQAGLLILLAVCGYALWRGGGVERIGAAVMLLAWIVSPLAQIVGQRTGPQYGLIAVDGALLVVLIALALRSDRWWPLSATAFQALGALTHVAVLLDHKVWPLAYITANIIFSYLVIAALLAGTVAYHGRRRSRRGAT